MPLHFSFSNHFQPVPKHGNVPKECKLHFNPSSANSFSNLERSELTRFRDRAGQRWKANAGPCFPAKGATNERTNSAPCRGFMSMEEPIFDGFFVDFNMQFLAVMRILPEANRLATA